jgi:hypothetical protein
MAAIIGAVVLVACGGGGDDAPAVAAPTVTISAANQGAVTRAMVDGGQAFGQSQPFGVTGRTTAQSAPHAPAALRIGALQSVVRRGLGHSPSVATPSR